MQLLPRVFGLVQGDWELLSGEHLVYFVENCLVAAQRHLTDQPTLKQSHLVSEKNGLLNIDIMTKLTFANQTYHNNRIPLTKMYLLELMGRDLEKMSKVYHQISLLSSYRSIVKSEKMLHRRKSNFTVVTGLMIRNRRFRFRVQVILILLLL